jgi:predicted nucleic acid-binding Zn ribbon protein
MDIMRNWRNTPFENEGPARAGLRSGLCLNGYSWSKSDATAGDIVSECLRLLGARRPTWIQGQPEYVIPRENCQRCHLPLDSSDIGNQRRFCSDECMKAAKLHRNDFFQKTQAIASSVAFYQAIKATVPLRDCLICGTPYRSAGEDTRTCSPTCAAKIRTDYVPEKPCEHCGESFKGRSLTSRFCSVDCTAAAIRASLPMKDCEQCGEPFQPGKPTSRFCCKECRARSNYEKAKAKRAKAAADTPIQRLFGTYG